LHEAFYCERYKHGIFGSILAVRTRMHFNSLGFCVLGPKFLFEDLAEISLRRCFTRDGRLRL
jgi:hypothetical protein